MRIKLGRLFIMAILSLVLIGFYSTSKIAFADEGGTTSASGFDDGKGKPGKGKPWKTFGNDKIDPDKNFLGTTDHADLVIKTDNIERMRVTYTGNVGIGTEAPVAHLHIQSGEEADDGLLVVANVVDSKFVAVASGASGTFPTPMGPIPFDFSPGVFWNSGDPMRFGTKPDPVDFAGFMEWMRIDENGNVGIGTGMAGPTVKLEVAGDVMANVFTVASDARFKKDITPLRGALDKVNNLQGVNYNWRTDEYKEKNFSDKRNIGIIAQELEKVVPEVVHTGSDGYKSVEYSKLVPLLIEAIKEQQEEIKQLKETVSTLVARQNDLETMFLAVSTTLPKEKLVKLDRLNSDEGQKVVQ